MNLHQLTLHHIRMSLKTPFTNSWGTVNDRDLIIVVLQDKDEVTGLGECVAFTSPWYTEETIQSAWYTLEDFLIPLVRQTTVKHPHDLVGLFAKVRRHHMAKAALEGAVWDLYAKQSGVPLAQVLGGTRTHIKAGVVIGTQSSVNQMLAIVETRLAEGYKRIKVKIKPGADVTILRAMRRAFPDIPLAADANGAYTWADREHLKQIDEFNLTMLEQPFANDDLLNHAKLQTLLQTPICLDESISSFQDARQALEFGSGRIINIKPGRVGGLIEAKRIHDFCASRNIPVWCGGMLESGIARTHNIALASLHNFRLPGDISASSRYWDRDIITPEVEVHNGMVQVPQHAGIGYDLDERELQKVTLTRKHFSL